MPSKHKKKNQKKKTKKFLKTQNTNVQGKLIIKRNRRTCSKTSNTHATENIIQDKQNKHAIHIEYTQYTTPFIKT